MMPCMDGFETCKLLRKKAMDTAVIMLTAKDEVEERVKGLKAGSTFTLCVPIVNGGVPA